HLKQSLNGWGGKRKKAKLQNEIYKLEEEKNFYIASAPDPREIDYLSCSPFRVLPARLRLLKRYLAGKEGTHKG
ncbi:unnamed protein product, partial [marine sediment metagenome]